MPDNESKPDRRTHKVIAASQVHDTDQQVAQAAGTLNAAPDTTAAQAAGRDR